MGISEVLVIIIINMILTYMIRCHIVNKNIEDFRRIAERLHFPEELCVKMEKVLDRKPELYDLIPGLNIGLAIKDWILRKREMELLEGDIKHFENEYGPIEQLVVDEPKEKSRTENQFHKYFVGYFLDDKAIVIYFNYDGDDDLVISDESCPTFNALDDDTKVATLMKILYKIYIGDKEYIRCNNINEVFTEIMVMNLENIFEFGNVDYTIERKAVSALVRRKPKNEN